ncbi:MAG: formyl-CoA transferase [Ilumatobacteraceae bacterium]|nr:formyl-CoA transferase [Ilumatobacteraceae bacterium]
MGVLDGTRVVDFGRYIAGPYCGALLGDLGAEVIRVERVEGGEDRWITPVTSDGVGALYLQCNRGKRGMTLDVTKPEGREVVARLIRTADVVIANLPAGTLRSMGLDDDTLRALKPDIILATVNAWGSGGEWSHKVGFDGLAQAASGNMFLSGPPGQPSRAAVPYVDFSTATITALSTLAALMHRRQTGEGQVIEASLLRTAVTWNSANLIEQAMLGVDRVSTHNRTQTAGPADVFRTRDGWVMCLALGSYQFRRWAEMIDRTDLLDDDRFKDDLSRGDNGVALSAYMGAWCADRTTDECLAEMDRHKVPGGPVLSPQQLLDLPHVRQVGILQDIDYPTATVASPLAGFPAVLSASPGIIRSRAPQLGEHTAEILGELGYDDAAVAALRGAGIV